MQFELFKKYPRLKVVVTERQWNSVSQFNPSEKANPNQHIIHRKMLKDFLSADALIIPHQVHGKNVYNASLNTGLLPPCDGLVSNKPKQAIGVLGADCVPIMIFDPVQNVIGVAHAGWKGTREGIASALIHKMQIDFQSNSADLLVFIGPSICPNCFLVRQDVHDQFIDTYPDHISRVAQDQWKIDLWGINRVQLISAEVPDSQIQIADICTYEHTNRFYSARKEGNQTGRFACVMMLE